MNITEKIRGGSAGLALLLSLTVAAGAPATAQTEAPESPATVETSHPGQPAPSQESPAEEAPSPQPTESPDVGLPTQTPSTPEPGDAESASGQQELSETEQPAESQDTPTPEAAAVAPALSVDTEPWALSLNWAEWSLEQSRVKPAGELKGAPGATIKVDYTAKVRTTPRSETTFGGEFTIANEGTSETNYELWLTHIASDREPLQLGCKWEHGDSASTGSSTTLSLPAGEKVTYSFTCDANDLTGKDRQLVLHGRVAGSADPALASELVTNYQDQDEHVIYTDRTLFTGEQGKETKLSTFEGWRVDAPFTRNYTVPDTGCDGTQGSSVILAIDGDNPEKLSHYLPEKVCATAVASPTPTATESPTATTPVTVVKDEPARPSGGALARTGAESTPLLWAAGALLLVGAGIRFLATRTRTTKQR